MPFQPLFSQHHYRFRRDNGTEEGATWIDSADTPVYLIREKNYRLRIRIKNIGDEVLGLNAALQYRIVGGADWQDLPSTAGASRVHSSDSLWYAGGDVALERLPYGEPFLWGQMADFSPVVVFNYLYLANGWTTECEFCFQIGANVPVDSTIEFRLHHSYEWYRFEYPSIPTLVVAFVETVKVFPLVLSAIASVQSPTTKVIAVPAVLSAVASVSSPVPIVKHFPAVLSAAASVQSAIGEEKITHLPGVLSAVASLQQAGFTAESITISPPVLIAAASLPPPVPEVKHSPAVLSATASHPAATPVVTVHPAVLSAVASWPGLGADIASVDVLSAVASLQTPTPKVIVYPPVLTCAATMPASVPIVKHSPAVLSAIAAVQAPTAFSFIPTEEGFPRIAEAL